MTRTDPPSHLPGLWASLSRAWLEQASAPPGLAPSIPEGARPR